MNGSDRRGRHIVQSANEQSLEAKLTVYFHEPLITTVTAER